MCFACSYYAEHEAMRTFIGTTNLSIIIISFPSKIFESFCECGYLLHVLHCKMKYSLYKYTKAILC